MGGGVSTPSERNIGIGDNTFYSIATTGASCNVAIGDSAAGSLVTGDKNTAVGYNVQVTNTTNQSVAIGDVAHAMGHRAVSVGANASANFETTALGTGAGNSESQSSVFLGSFAGQLETANNKLYVDNTNTSSPLIYGEFDNNYLKVNGSFEITGTFTTPSVSDTEFNYLNGVTSSIQDQLDDKLDSATASTTYAPLSAPSFTGDVTVGGNLTVNGTTTNINSTNLVVEDKNIVLGDVTTPSNITANGGGITLNGDTNKTFNWVNSTGAWTSSEHLDLVSGKVLKIDGTQVLSASQYTGNAATVTNGVYTSGSYSDPSWLTISKSKVGLGDVENTAISTWAGSTNITTLGTIGTGTWNATTIATTKGGTGLTSYSTGDILYASGSNTLAKLSAGTNGQVLTLDSGVPTWAAAAVTYSAPTIGSTSITSGSTVTQIDGLTLGSTKSVTISGNTATAIDTVALSGFTTTRYIVSIKQGSKVRSSVVIAQTDGTSVDYTEYGIVETGGKMTGILPEVVVSSTNAVFRVTITDASATNATVKIQKVLI